MPTTRTPLRYPGGKTKIYPMVSDLLTKNKLIGCTYAEAFCGGAGLAIKLLLENKVSKIIINDLDPAIYSVWDLIVNNPSSLVSFIETVEINMDTWEHYKEVYESSHTPSQELGVAAFFLNRTNRSGIIDGGVIGGKEQTGKYKIDARFNRSDLIKKIKQISAQSNNISVTNLDAVDFMKYLNSLNLPNIFLYLDPPYVQKGPGLYKSSFDKQKHIELSNAVKSYQGSYMITYDVDKLVDELYKPSKNWPIYSGNLEIGYSASSTRKLATERLVLSPNLQH